MKVLSFSMTAFLGGGVSIIASPAVRPPSVFTPTSDAQTGPVEVLHGRDARTHLATLKRRRPQPFELAEKRMLARGFSPTDQVVVLRTEHAAAGTSRSETGIDLAQSVATSDGEIIFEAWDDGDDSTWEGTMWIQRYTDGAEILQETQFDISSAAASVLWEDTVWRKPPVVDYVDLDVHPPLTAPRLDGATASLGGMIPSRDVELVTVMPKPARDWIGCVIATCVAGAVGCAFSGPAWLECAVLVCATAKAVCTLQVILSYW
jgi:hypothetical protein